MIYVIQVQTGKESEVCKELARREIRAYAPSERIIIRKSGLWTKKLKLFFPGYAFTDMEYSAEMFHRIKDVSGVIRFLGSPTPLPRHEADMIILLANGGRVIEPSTAITDECGNISGFEGFLSSVGGNIAYINKRQKKVTVYVKFDGKLHRANISFDFPDKADDITGQG